MADPGSVPDELEAVRDDEAKDAIGGGMGRAEVPRNLNDVSPGEFPRDEDDATTPG